MRKQDYDYLKQIHVRIKKLSCSIGTKLYENVPVEESWLTLDGFIKDNKIRYYRAVVKWKNYNRTVIRNDRNKGELKISNIWFVRKIREKGFTKENTVFTSPSDARKYASCTHKYIIEDRLLGTRDIKNILKKKGIDIRMESIVRNLRSNKDVFLPKKKEYIKWKNKYRSFINIAKLEKVDSSVLKRYYYKNNDIAKSIALAKNTNKRPVYEFEGRMLQQYEICNILSERTGILKETIRGRFKKHGFYIDILSCKTHLNEKNSNK